MKNRIRQLRKALNLNQTEFGERLGVKQGAIAGYETGARNPMDAVIISICREFNVNEEWLRTGNGEMFVPVFDEDETAALVSDLLEDDPDNPNPLYSIIKGVMKTYNTLDPKSKEVLVDFSFKLLETLKNEKED